MTTEGRAVAVAAKERKAIQHTHFTGHYLYRLCSVFFQEFCPGGCAGLQPKADLRHGRRVESAVMMIDEPNITINNKHDATSQVAARCGRAKEALLWQWCRFEHAH